MHDEHICKAEQGSAVLQILAGIGRVYQRARQSQKERPGLCALPQLQAHSLVEGWLVWQVSLHTCLLHICSSAFCTCL